MPTFDVSIIKGDKVDSRIDYKDNLLENMIAIDHPVYGVNGYVTTYPGLTSFGIGKGYDRGATFNERFETHFRLSGTKLISVSSAGTVTELGDIPGTQQARMEGLTSFNTQGIIVNGNFFLYDPTSGFRQVTDPDLGTPIDGVWINGYYFLTDGEYVYHTDINNEETIDPLKFATAEFMPDSSLGVAKTQDDKVVVFGRYTIEYFTDTATENFAFKRLDTRAQKIGIVATHAKSELGGIFFILGGVKNGSISTYAVTLGAYNKIASKTVDEIIGAYDEAELQDVRVESRAEEDLNLILYHLPNETLCYNASIGAQYGNEAAWTILKSDLAGSNTYRGINGIFDPYADKWLYGDKFGTGIGYLDYTKTAHFDTAVDWAFYTPFLNLETLSVDEIDIKTIAGFVTANDSKVAFSASLDGYFYGQEVWFDYSQIQEYLKRFIIYDIGYVPNIICFKFRGIGSSRMSFALMRVTVS